MLEKHYDFTAETKMAGKETLRRIVAVVDDPGGKFLAGDLGGWLGENATLEDNGWVADEAAVYGQVCVSGNGLVCDNAEVFDRAIVTDEAMVMDDARVHGSAKISGSAEVCDSAVVSGKAKIKEEASVCSEAIVSDKVTIGGGAIVCGQAAVRGRAQLSGDVLVGKNAVVTGTMRVSGAADITGDAILSNNVVIDFDANIHETRDVLVVGSFGPNSHRLYLVRMGSREGIVCLGPLRSTTENMVEDFTSELDLSVSDIDELKAIQSLFTARELTW